MPSTLVTAAASDASTVRLDRTAGSTRRRLTPYAPYAAALAVFVLRAVLIPATPTEWDSVLILEGVRHFDVVRSAPHPPGSFLYVQATALLHALTGGSALAVASTLSAAMSGACAGLAWAIGRRLRSDVLGLGFALAVTANPVAAFYGSIVATYTVDLLAGMMLLHCAVRVREQPRYVTVAALTVGLAAGARPSALVFAAPALVVIVAMARPNRRQLAWAAGALAASVLVWLVPLALVQPGGLGAWRAATNRTFHGQYTTTSWLGAPRAAAVRNAGSAFSYATIAVLPLLPATLVAIAGRVQGRRRLLALEGWMLGVAAAIVVPGLAFGAFVHWGKSGYLLVFLPGLLVVPFVLASRLRAAWFTVFMVLACAGAGVQMQRFYFADSVLPPRFVDRGPYFTERRFWAPFDDTLHGRDELDAMHERAVSLLRRAGVSDRDHVVMVDVNGGPDFAHVEYAFGRTTVDYIGSKGWINRARDGYMNAAPGGSARATLPPPGPGGRVFALLWNAPPELAEAVRDGRATEVVRGDGESVWRIDAPVTIGGVTIETR